jgi:hypothetical protein
VADGLDGALEMDHLFLVKLGLSFIVGGTLITLCTVVAERFGSTAGGIIGGLPFTSGVTLLFVALVNSPEAASQATDVIPLVLGFNGLYLVLYAMLARYGLGIGLGGALSGWFVLALSSVWTRFSSFWLSLGIFALLLGLSLYLLDRRLGLPTYEGSRTELTPMQVLGRAIFGGAVISLAVFLSKVGGPLLGGVFSAFPAVFTSTLFIAYRSRGVEFSRALTRPLLISGMINVAVYALATRYLYLWVGPFLGTALALILTAGSAYGTLQLARGNRAPYQRSMG